MLSLIVCKSEGKKLESGLCNYSALSVKKNGVEMFIKFQVFEMK